MQVDIRKVAGTHLPLYEAWYHQVDPKNIGSIGALDAANFLKKSGLSSTILSKVWELSDPYGRGYLDKTGLFLALKFISLAQNGLEVSVTNVNLETPAPNMGELPPALPSVPVMPVSSALISPPVSNQALDWTVKPEDAAKYNALFDSLDPVNETLSGNKVRGALLNSKLPVETLGKIWDLSDIDKDGALDRHEFTVAMHLVYKVLDGYPLPATLPEPLAAPKYTPSTSMTFDRKPSLAGAVQVLPSIPPLAAELKGPLQPPPIPVSPWVVSVVDKAKYEAMFQVADVDKDGFVSGLEIKDAFLQSGLPQPILAHIWNLCDMGQTGKLNVEQFALAMWLVQKKLSGGELPTVLTPEMVPPSMRRTTEPIKDESTNAELEEIAKEIEAMAMEKRQLETEIAQKEADIKIKQGEVRTLQTEFETLSATLRQLEHQKKEAQKRLDDLNNQQVELEHDLRVIKRDVADEELRVTTLRGQLAEQEKTLKAQEDEMVGKRQELNQLKQEETKIENDVTACKNSLDSLNRNLQDTQLHISQVKAKMTVLEEQQRQMQDAISAFDSALENEDASVANDYLNATLSPTFQDPEFSRMDTPTRNTPSLTNGTKLPFGDTDPFSSHNAPARPPPPVNGDPFADSDFFSKVNTSRGTANDPFGAPADPFASAFGAPVPSKNDPFAAFDSFGSTGNSASTTAGSDPFGSDPFGAPRAESPTPALPPKKAKQPPPRPAPPKSAGPKPQRPAPPVAKNDPFAAAPVPVVAPSSAANSDPFGGFADFANFDSKFSSTGDEGDVWSGLSSSSSSLSSSAWGGGGSGHSHSKKLKPPTFPAPVPTQAPPPTQTQRYAEFEFTEDPFKDVKFGDVDSDPFADAFAPSLPPVNSSDPFAPPISSQNSRNESNVKKNGWDAWNEGSSVSHSTSSSAWETEFPDSDPFSAGATEDSFPSTKRSNKSSGFVSSTLKTKLGFSLPISPLKSKKIGHEESQLAWVAAESIREEEERIKRLELQEKADLELALALSQSEIGTENHERSFNLK